MPYRMSLLMFPMYLYPTVKKTILPIKTFLFVILCALACIIPWWGVLIVVFACLAVFRSFSILVLIGFLMDVLYGSSVSRGLPFLFTALVVISIIALPIFKRRLSIMDALA